MSVCVGGLVKLTLNDYACLCLSVCLGEERQPPTLLDASQFTRFSFNFQSETVRWLERRNTRIRKLNLLSELFVDWSGEYYIEPAPPAEDWLKRCKNPTEPPFGVLECLSQSYLVHDHN